MEIIVTVTEAELRGVPFRKYSDVLHNLIDELHWVEINIRRGNKLSVEVIEPKEKPAVALSLSNRKPKRRYVGPKPDVKEIRAMARQMTMKKYIDGYFG